jgi:hypothetical protein
MSFEEKVVETLALTVTKTVLILGRMSGEYDVTVGDERNGITNMPTAGVYTFF